jgi:energy-coupling factor transporter transmembrane protein EcfT
MMDYAHFGLGFLPVKFFCLVFFLGVVLFVIWAARLDKKTLKKWFISMLVVGAVGMLICSLLLKSYGYDKDWKGWKMDGDGNMVKIMDEMMEEVAE